MLGLHGLEVALARCRKAGFKHVYAQKLELMGHAQLFLEVHGAAGGLLAVAQCCIKDNEAIAGHKKRLLCMVGFVCKTAALRLDTCRESF